MEITLRDVTADDAAALAHILVSANEHAFRGHVPDQCLTFTEVESAANWQDFLADGLPTGDVMIVAQTSTGEVVGYAWGGSDMQYEGYASELRQISILPAYQGMGIGKRLVRHIAQRLAVDGIHSMRVEVLEVNPNRMFYERLGAVYVSQFPYDWEGVRLTMCVYGWLSTRPLLQD